jgi:hypothetical protein
MANFNPYEMDVAALNDRLRQKIEDIVSRQIDARLDGLSPAGAGPQDVRMQCIAMAWQYTERTTTEGVIAEADKLAAFVLRGKKPEGASND